MIMNFEETIRHIVNEYRNSYLEVRQPTWQEEEDRLWTMQVIVFLLYRLIADIIYLALMVNRP